MLTVVADFVKDPVGGECGGDGDEDGGVDNGAIDHRDDVGDQCFCSENNGGGGDDQDRDVGVDLDDLVSDVTAPTSPSGRRRCSRWYPRLRALVAGALHRSGGVGVLVNSAGTCYPHPEYFAGMMADGRVDGDGSMVADRGAPQPLRLNTRFCDTAERTVRCNVTALMHACRLAVPGMMRRGRGLIVNVSSASAAVPASPLMTVYSATKVKCPGGGGVVWYMIFLHRMSSRQRS